LQRAAEYAMGEIKELSPSSSANIRAIQSHPSMRGARAEIQQRREQQQALKRMGTIDRKSAVLTARKELVLALYELGMSFLKGWGVTKDKVVAFHYFQLAADLVRGLFVRFVLSVFTGYFFLYSALRLKINYLFFLLICLSPHFANVTGRPRFSE